MPPIRPWKTRDRRTLLAHSKYLTVEEHTVELPDGAVISDWPFLILPQYVNIVAVTDDEQFICFRQTKYAVEGVTLAITGGYIEPDEDPLDAAQRELLEETGYRAKSWTPLGSYVVSANRGAGVAHLYLATGAQWVTEVDSDDLEDQELVLLSRSEIEQAVAQGEFKVLPWIAALSLALLRHPA